MEIETKAMGTVSIVEKQIIELEEGFYGFSQYHRFALVDAKENPFIWVQSLEKRIWRFCQLIPSCSARIMSSILTIHCCSRWRWNLPPM